MDAPPERYDFGPTGASTHAAVGPYLRAVRRHWRFVLLVTVLTAAVTAVTVLRSARTYQASTSVLVTPLPGGDPAWIGIGAVIESGDPARDLQTAVALISSAQAASATASAMGPSWNTQRVQDAVSITPLGQSDVVSITANGSTPAEAARLANNFAKSTVAIRGGIVQRNIAKELATLQARIAQLGTKASSIGSGVTNLNTQVDELEAAQATHGDPSISVTQTAQPPNSPIGTSHALILLLALVGGFALASVAALGLEFFSRPVRDEEELTQLFPVPILASIPPVRHRGHGALSPWLLPPEAFEQVRILRVQLELAGNAPVIMVTSASAGDGKTTLAAALAAAFSESGQDVILMDLDLRKPSLGKALGIDISPVGTSRNAWWTQEEAEMSLDGLVPIPNLPNVRLLPLPVAGESSIDEVVLRLPALLAHAQRLASCVIVDTAPVAEVSESLRIAPMCGTVVFVARPRHTDRRRLVIARDLLFRSGVRTAGLVLMGHSLAKTYGGGSYGYAYPGPNGSVSSSPLATRKATVVSSRSEPSGR